MKKTIKCIEGRDLAEFGKLLEEVLPSSWGLSFKYDDETGGMELSLCSVGCCGTAETVAKAVKGFDTAPVKKEAKVAKVNSVDATLRLSTLITRLQKYGHPDWIVSVERDEKGVDTMINLRDGFTSSLVDTLTGKDEVRKQVALVESQIAELKEKLGRA